MSFCKLNQYSNVSVPDSANIHSVILQESVRYSNNCSQDLREFYTLCALFSCLFYIKFVFACCTFNIWFVKATFVLHKPLSLTTHKNACLSKYSKGRSVNNLQTGLINLMALMQILCVFKVTWTDRPCNISWQRITVS